MTYTLKLGTVAAPLVRQMQLPIVDENERFVTFRATLLEATRLRGHLQSECFLAKGWRRTSLQRNLDRLRTATGRIVAAQRARET